MTKSRWVGVAFTIFAILFALNLPPMKGTARFEVYEVVKVEFETFKEIRETNEVITQNDYEELKDKLKSFKEKYETSAEVKMISYLEKLYRTQAKQSTLALDSEEYKNNESVIVDYINEMEMLLREYELK